MLPCHIEPAVEDRRDQRQSEAVSGNEGREGEMQIAGKSRGAGIRGPARPDRRARGAEDQ